MDGLWKKRALLLKAISRLIGVSSDEPALLLKQAKKSLENGLEKERAEVLRILMKNLRKVREEIFLKMREKFSKMFLRAEIKFGEEGVAMLEEKLLSCIDHCKLGKEESFPGYFMEYAKRAFSEMEDERMSDGFYIPRRDKLILRKNEDRERKYDEPLIRVELTDIADHTTAQSLLEAKEKYAEIAWEKKDKRRKQDNAWWQLLKKL